MDHKWGYNSGESNLSNHNVFVFFDIKKEIKNLFTKIKGVCWDYFFVMIYI